MVTGKTASKETEMFQKLHYDRSLRAKELKATGNTIVGYLCAYTPVELLTAAGTIPFRLSGDINQPITKADTNVETIVCPFIRSCFDLAVKGNYDFLDGLVIPHACDSICKTYDAWKYEFNRPFSYFIDIPHVIDKSSKEYFRTHIKAFIKALEEFVQHKISSSQITEATKLHNENRAKMRELYELRKQQPPLISGTEMMQVLIQTMSLPVKESTQVLADTIQEIKDRNITTQTKLPRLLVYGAQIDNNMLINAIEQSDANVVMDDICIGSRFYWHDADITPDPIDGLVERYMEKIMCPRTFRTKKGNYQHYLEQRFGYINQFIKDFQVDGVVLYTYQYCDPLGFDVPALKSYIESKGVPVIWIEDDYSSSGAARLKTRVQAFIETISSSP